MRKSMPVAALIGVLGVVIFMLYTGAYIFIYMFRAFQTPNPVPGEVVEVWHGDPMTRAVFVAVLFLIGLLILVWFGLTRGEVISAGKAIRLRSDLWAWLVQQGDATNESPERVAERAIGAYRARLEGVSTS